MKSVSNGIAVLLVVSCLAEGCDNRSSSIAKAMKRGEEAGKKHEWDSAVAEFTEAIRLDRNCALAFNKRGSAYCAKDDLDKAIADFTAAIRLDPQLVEAYNNRASVHMRRMEWEQAIGYLKSA
jgi:tetratricopeptide (TPR) repeat protein